MSILSVKNLSKSYADFNLDNISFEVPKGSIMGIIGENGAGKTTTIKLILNLIKKDGGRVKVFGKDNIQEEKRIKQDIGVVLDESNFHDDLKPNEISIIMDNVYDKWDKNRFLNYLKEFRLPYDKKVKEFSKGMKMKLSIAAALSHDPKLLILDEPTGGLDPIVRSEILDIFLDYIQDEERSIIFSTHITSDLDKIADYITFIHSGKIVFSESSHELINSYGILKCGTDDFKKINSEDIIGYRKNQFGYNVLIKDKYNSKFNDYTIDNANLEDIMLYYIRRGKNEGTDN